MKVSIDIPEEIYRQAELAAQAERIPVEQLIGSAAAAHLAAWKTLKEKAARGSLAEFKAVLDQVPGVEPEETDK